MTRNRFFYEFTIRLSDSKCFLRLLSDLEIPFLNCFFNCSHQKSSLNILGNPILLYTKFRWTFINRFYNIKLIEFGGFVVSFSYINLRSGASFMNVVKLKCFLLITQVCSMLAKVTSLSLNTNSSTPSTHQCL